MLVSQEAQPRQVRFRPLIRLTRPSLFDPYLPDDRWITGCYLPNCLIVYLSDQPVSLLAGSPLEQATLNSMLFNMQHRYPRRVALA